MSFLPYVVVDFLLSGVLILISHLLRHLHPKLLFWKVVLWIVHGVLFIGAAIMNASGWLLYLLALSGGVNLGIVLTAWGTAIIIVVLAMSLDLRRLQKFLERK